MEIKQKEYFEQISMEANGFGNGHCEFALAGIQESQIDDLLSELQKQEKKGNELYQYFSCVCDASLEPCEGKEGVYNLTFASHNKYLPEKGLKDLSKAFPNIVCYANDAWDYPAYVVCVQDGEDQSLKDKADATVGNFEVNYDYIDNPDSYDDACYDLDMTLKDKEYGVAFAIGGGCICEEDVLEMIELTGIDLELSQAKNYSEVQNLSDDNQL